MNKEKHPVHGRKSDHPKVYQAYRSMKARCTNPNHVSYKYYGGRGIKICQKWLDSFWAFFEDVGRCPNLDWSIDRINSNGNYEPGNVRWADEETQRQNSRRARRPVEPPPVNRTGRRKRHAPPPYLFHKASNRAYVNIYGKERYLGVYGSAESRSRYREIVRAWEQDADRHLEKFSAKPGCTITELVAAHAEHARQHYRTAGGEPTSEQRAFALSLRPLLAEEYAEMPADEFRPAHLKLIRESWIAAGHARKTVNQSAGRIRRLFRWGAGEEIVSVETAGSLAMVKDLAEGRTAAPDHDDVEPVHLRDIGAVLRFTGTPAAVSSMIRLQFYCGARPGEVCMMRGEEIDQNGIVHVKKRKVQLPGGVWVFQPGRFKQRHTGKIVAYILGARAQAVLRALNESVDGFIFPSPKRKGQPWSVSGYQHAIADACLAAGTNHWSPGQLRHNFLSRLDAAAGIQLASYAVGHASIDTTAIYVERNLKAVAEAMAKLG